MIGTCTGTGCAPRRSRIICTAPQKSAADAVHLVDEGDARNAVLVGLAPDRLRLRLDPADRAEDGDGPVEDAQASARPRP